MAEKVRSRFEFEQQVEDFLKKNGFYVIKKGRIPDIIAKIFNKWVWIECKSKDEDNEEFEERIIYDRYNEFNIDTFRWVNYGETSIKPQLVREILTKNKKYKNTLFTLVFTDNVRFVDSESKYRINNLPRFIIRELSWKYGSEKIAICTFSGLNDFIKHISKSNNL